MTTTQITLSFGQEHAGATARLYGSLSVGAQASLPFTPVNPEKLALTQESLVLVGQGSLDSKGKLTFQWEDAEHDDVVYQGAVELVDGWHLTNPLGQLSNADPWYDQIVDGYAPSAAIGADFSEMTNQLNQPAVYGDTIRTISDYTGNGYNFTERAVGAGPQLVENGLGNFDALDFDFSDNEYLVCDINANGGLVNLFETDEITILAIGQVETDEAPTSRVSLIGTEASDSVGWPGIGRLENSTTMWTNIGFAFHNIANIMLDQVPALWGNSGIDDGVTDERNASVGEFVNTPTTITSALNLGQRVWIGSNSRSGYTRWNGKCSAVFFWNRKLSATEIKEISDIVHGASRWYTSADNFVRSNTTVGSGDINNPMWVPMSDLYPTHVGIVSSVLQFDGITSGAGEGFVRTEKLVGKTKIVINANVFTDASSSIDDSISYWLSADDSETYDNGYRFYFFSPSNASLYRVNAGVETLVGTLTIGDTDGQRTLRLEVSLSGDDPSFELFDAGVSVGVLTDTDGAKFNVLRRFGVIGKSSSAIREHYVGSLMLHCDTPPQTVTVQFDGATTLVAGDTPQSVSIPVTVITSDGQPLQNPVSVNVRDLGTGSAITPTDYTMTTPQTLNWPASNPSGTTQEAILSVAGANNPDCTVNLDLDAASGAEEGAQNTHEVTILNIGA